MYEIREKLPNNKFDEQKSLNFREKFLNYYISTSPIASFSALLGAPFESFGH